MRNSTKVRSSLTFGSQATRLQVESRQARRSGQISRGSGCAVFRGLVIDPDDFVLLNGLDELGCKAVFA
ncbi:MAG TPA: hypothetical protein PKX94_03975 [Opitutales bacterium]|nr:hypothetical protein [Opitutales bacterium]